MMVYVLIREDQNEHGFIDTAIPGVFLARQAANERQALESRLAGEEGFVIENDDSDGDWQVCWRIEDHDVAEYPTDHFLECGQGARPH